MEERVSRGMERGNEEKRTKKGGKGDKEHIGMVKDELGEGK